MDIEHLRTAPDGTLVCDYFELTLTHERKIDGRKIKVDPPVRVGCMTLEEGLNYHIIESLMGKMHTEMLKMAGEVYKPDDVILMHEAEGLKDIANSATKAFLECFSVDTDTGKDDEKRDIL